VAYVGGLLRFTPATDFNGAVTLTYQVTDGEDTDTGTVSVTVEEVSNTITLNSASLERREDDDLDLLFDLSYDGEGALVGEVSLLDGSGGSAVETDTFEIDSASFDLTGLLATELDAGDFLSFRLLEDGTAVVSNAIELEVPTENPVASGVVVTPIGAAPTTLASDSHPTTANFTRTEAGRGVFVIAGRNFGTQTSRPITSVTYGGVALDFDVISSEIDDRNYICFAYDDGTNLLPTGANALNIGVQGDANMLNPQGAQHFQISGGVIGTPVNVQSASAAALSANLGALAEGAGAIAGAYAVAQSSGFTFSGATETGALTLGSNEMSAAALSDLDTATDPYSIGADNSGGSGTETILAVLPITPT
jgi:hypothetical protein